MTNMRRLILIVAIVLVGLALFFSLHHTPGPAPPKLGPVVTGCASGIPSKGAITAALQNQNYAPGKFTGITVNAIREPSRCWDVVSVSKQGAVEEQTIIIKRVGSSMYVSAGPSTSFPQSLMDQLNVPSSVQNTVVVYNDLSPSNASQ